MSDSSNPMVNRVEDETEPTPYDAGSSASSLGAPQPDLAADADPGMGAQVEPTPDESAEQADPSLPEGAETPNNDINGDPEQVS